MHTTFGVKVVLLNVICSCFNVVQRCTQSKIRNNNGTYKNQTVWH